MFAGGAATLPWELLIMVVSHLPFEDFVNLKAARYVFLRALRNEALCREIVKVDPCSFPNHRPAWLTERGTEMHPLHQRSPPRRLPQ